MNETNIHSNQIVFPIHKLVMGLDKVGDMALQKKLNISLSQYLIMKAINHCPQNTQKRISTYLGLTEAAVSRHIENLRERKYVLRTENPENRREHILELTSSGESQFKKAEKIFDNTLEENFENIGQNKRKVLLECINQLLEEMGIKDDGTLCSKS